MRALVTGVAGFIGSHVADGLLRQGWDVMGIDDLSGGTMVNVPKDAKFINRDVGLDLDDLMAEFQPKVVYHLAAYAAEGLSHHIPVFNYQNNIVATANVLASAYRHGAKHFVFTSSIAAYGHPRKSNSDAGGPQRERLTEDDVCSPCDPYGIAKLACEHHIQAFFDYYGGPTYTIIRPHNVFGPKQNVSDPYRNVVGIFIRQAISGQPMTIFGDGQQTRSFSYIDSVAQCIAASGWTEAAKNQTFNVGGDEPMSVIELAKRVCETVGVDENIQHLAPRQEVLHAHADHKKAHQLFPEIHRSPVSIQAGLKATVQHVTENEIPTPTHCPSAIEIKDKLPPLWRDGA
ncbi:UDP-glucose 4-epimerase [Rubripirellula obstinata]|uniref:UDP-glucose 4-epimerase n=1 Tax=Rubripirellula obstinata TaxID=406547 RepID=A0A5B1CJP5_9BACT|nr:NAD-dependent epimerase/dehydratase family protein [Rubripirellula obstinata]KAA1259673.1 UDP-glucose 4-epimerase [Rubripirellula obstinata]